MQDADYGGVPGAQYGDDGEYYDDDGEYYDDEAGVGSVGESPLKMFLQQLDQQMPLVCCSDEGQNSGGGGGGSGSRMPPPQRQPRPTNQHRYPQQFQAPGAASGGASGPMLGTNIHSIFTSGDSMLVYKCSFSFFSSFFFFRTTNH